MSSPNIFSSLTAPSGVIDYFQSFLPEDISSLFDDNFPSIDPIDDFQLQILRVTLFILCVNLIFIWIAWRKYGEKITERFMKPASSKSLEDLKREATELKLPKEHTPRI